MRAANCRWLSPLPKRIERIAAAKCKWPRLWPLVGMTCGGGGGETTSGSSSSNDPWQRRHRLLVVRNWTSRQRSQRTTSLESTGARAVAIRFGRGQSGLPDGTEKTNQTRYLVPDLQRNLRYKHCGCQVKSGCGRWMPGPMPKLTGEERANKIATGENSLGRITDGCEFHSRAEKTGVAGGLARLDRFSGDERGKHEGQRRSLVFTN